MTVEVTEPTGVAAVTGGISPDAPVDADILELLKSASRYWLLPHEAYLLDTMSILDRAQDAAMRAMIPFAEMFYTQIQTIVPKESIRQHRIGIDAKTGIPTSLTVIAHSQEDKMMELMRVARNLEWGLFHLHGYNYCFWTIFDSSLDQEMIDLDFPYYKSNP